MKRKACIWFLVLVLAASLCAGCAAKGANDSAAEEYYSQSGGGGPAYTNDSAASPESTEGGFEAPLAPPADYDTGTNESMGGDEDPLIPAVDPQIESGLKIIYTSSMHVETLNFDESYAHIQAQLKIAGGYTSYSQMYGGKRSDGSYVNRNAELVLRIPVNKYEAFLTASGEFGNITRRSDTAEDVTSSYLDVEARIKSLKTEEERLLALVDKAADLEALLKLENRLSEVRMQIERYQSTQMAYDNLITYCTVNITLVEVSLYTQPNTKGFGQVLKEAVIDSANAVLGFLKGLLVTLIYLLPFLVLALIVFLIARTIVRRTRPRRAAARAARAEKKAAAEQAAREQAAARLATGSTDAQNPYLPKKK